MCDSFRRIPYVMFAAGLLSLLALCATCQADKPTAEKPTREPAPGPVRRSDVEFEKIFGSMESDPKKRDYPTILKQVEQLCRDYPGSGASHRAYFAVRKWRDMGLISVEAAAQVLGTQKKANPAEAKLKALLRGSEHATEDQLWEIVSELRRIAQQHPDTESQFIACGALAEIVARAGGEPKVIIRAADQFLDKFPYGKTEYGNIDQYTYSNLFRKASALRHKGDVKEAMAFYEQIAETFQGRATFAMPALEEAGALALKDSQGERAIACYAELQMRYADADRDHAIIWRFRIAEAQQQLGRTDEAIETLEKIAEDHPKTRWEAQAKSAIEFYRDSRDAKPGKLIPNPKPSQGQR